MWLGSSCVEVGAAHLARALQLYDKSQPTNVMSSPHITQDDVEHQWRLRFFKWKRQSAHVAIGQIYKFDGFHTFISDVTKNPNKVNV